MSKLYISPLPVRRGGSAGGFFVVSLREMLIRCRPPASAVRSRRAELVVITVSLVSPLTLVKTLIREVEAFIKLVF